MTDNITLPRSVVEQALETLSNTGTQRGKQPSQFLAEGLSINALRAALEQPQVQSGEIPPNWKLVPMEPTEEMLSCIRDHVRDYPGWWEHSYRDLIKAAPQPPVVEQPQPVDEKPEPEPEPVAFLTRDEEGDPSMLFFDRREAEGYCDDGEEPTPLYARTQPQVEQEPVAWANINKHGDITHTSNKKMAWAKTPLYAHPQPPRQPLTDEQIACIEDGFSNEFGLEAKHSIDFARAIERAHGIGGKE